MVSQKSAIGSLPTMGLTVEVAMEPPKIIDAPRTQRARLQEAERRQAEMQGWWDQSISRNMDLPDWYLKVSVLIIKWRSDLDDLCVGKEVEEVSEIFEKMLGYHVQTLELHNEKSPQLQLFAAISQFALENDGPNNLMIVYYAGHGMYHQKNGYLELAGSINAADCPGDAEMQSAKVIWEKADQIFIDDSRGDVLAIMDCCFASNMVRDFSPTGRTYQLLAASHKDQTTPGPGPHSFTKALITSLKDLIKDAQDGFFSSWDLYERISKARGQQPPAIWNRRKGVDRCIRLQRMKDQQQPSKKEPDLPPKAYLSLQFHLREDKLSQQQIKNLTRELPRTFRKCHVGLQNIVWLGIKPRCFRDIVEAARILRNPAMERKRTTWPLPHGTGSRSPKVRPSDMEEGELPAKKRVRAESGPNAKSSESFTNGHV